MSQYKLATYQSPQGPRAGLIVDETIFDLAAATGRPGYATVLDVLRDWDAARTVLADAANSAAKKTEGRPLKGTKLLPPVPAPDGIFCAGANFSDHMMEMAKVQNIAPEPDPHEVEVSRPHLCPEDPHVLAVAGEIPIDLHWGRIVAVEAERRVPETHRLHSRQGLEAIAQVPHKELARLGAVSCLR